MVLELMKFWTEFWTNYYYRSFWKFVKNLWLKMIARKK